MADQTRARVTRYGRALRTAASALQFAPHAALLLLLVAVVLHALGPEGISEAVGDAIFFIVALGVIFRRNAADNT